MHASNEVAFTLIASWLPLLSPLLVLMLGLLHLLPAHIILLFISDVKLDEIAPALSIVALVATIGTMLPKPNSDHVGVLAALPVVVPLIIAKQNAALCRNLRDTWSSIKLTVTL